MKTAIRKFRIAALACTIFFTMGTSTASMATTNTTISKAQIDMQYIGKYESYPVFQLKLDNMDNDAFYVTIKDGNGEVIHSETLKGQNMVRKYGFDVEVDDLIKMRVIVTSKRTHQSQEYQITRGSFQVESISVARL